MKHRAPRPGLGYSRGRHQNTLCREIEIPHQSHRDRSKGLSIRAWALTAAALFAVVPVEACTTPGTTVEPGTAVEPATTVEPGTTVAQPVSTSTTATPALVGEWARETTCDELVSALTQAGLEQWVMEGVAGNGFVPGVTSPDQIADAANPCDGAVPRRHSHFFTDDGEFGSLDWNGEQVDDGTYELIDENTFVIPKEFPNVTFDFTIEGDTIMFEPRIPDCSPDCFEAPWSVSVAYPGKTWERVG